jgi:hypothetical protein
MTEILQKLPVEVVLPVAAYPGLIKTMESWKGTDAQVLSALKTRLQG